MDIISDLNQRVIMPGISLVRVLILSPVSLIFLEFFAWIWFFIVPKVRFQELGLFARMIFDKLRQDYLDIFPTESSIRQSYIEYLQMNQSEILPINSQPFLNTKYKHHLKKINWIPSPTILRMKLLKKNPIHSCS